MEQSFAVQLQNGNTISLSVEEVARIAKMYEMRLHKLDIRDYLEIAHYNVSNISNELLDSMAETMQEHLENIAENDGDADWRCALKQTLLDFEVTLQQYK